MNVTQALSRNTFNLTQNISNRRVSLPSEKIDEKTRYGKTKNSLLNTIDPNFQKTLEVDEKARKKHLPDIIKMSYSTIKDLAQLSKTDEIKFINSFKDSV